MSIMEKINKLEKNWIWQNEQIAKLTDMLCRTLTSIDNQYGAEWPIDIGINKDIQAWWRLHKKLDAQRKEKENE